MQLNPEQRAAVEHESDGPLLIIAGAGTGKTTTLAHRVARLIATGTDPRRILLLTFTRRAAYEMTRRVERITARPAVDRSSRASSDPSRESAAPGEAAPPAVPAGRIVWSGTFHSVANRLLRLHAEAVGLDPSFTVLDREDAADLMNLVRGDLGLASQRTRFPTKGTCLAIYSKVVNTERPLEECLARSFPWCARHEEPLRRLFRTYVETKQAQRVLDYDDLLLYWSHLMSEPELAARVRERFDQVLVDEYQDTNTLQATILTGLSPNGRGVTVVGDDAQSIYSFRAATVRNILEFPQLFDPPARVLTLEHNYRSTQTILDACNDVIRLAPERFTKNLRSTRRSEQRPVLVTAEDEPHQVEYVVERILENREAGVPLRHQAVLMRAAHHSDELELSLAHRDIPFVKYGGLKFLEAAHVKDVLGILRFAENPHDRLAAFRVLQLLPGIGPAVARGVLDHLQEHAFSLASLGTFRAPPAAAADWRDLAALLAGLAGDATPWEAQLGRVRAWYAPHLERLHSAPHVRAADLEQLEHLSARFPSRERFLSELTLDPPVASGDEAGRPHLDEDYLILSTIHSAKGQEWDVVYVLHLADGCIPSDMATRDTEEIEEERRLLYVAMTRARDQLHLIHPLRFYVHHQPRGGDAHLLAPRSRFVTDEMLGRYERWFHGTRREADAPDPGAPGKSVDVASRLRDMWE